MKTSDFIDGIKDILEIENQNITKESVLKDLDNYSSLTTLAIIAYIDENFNMTINAQQLNSVGTINELMMKIGVEKFSE